MELDLIWTELGVAWSETGAYLDLTWTLPGRRTPPNRKKIYLDRTWSETGVELALPGVKLDLTWSET